MATNSDKWTERLDRDLIETWGRCPENVKRTFAKREGLSYEECQARWAYLVDLASQEMAKKETEALKGAAPIILSSAEIFLQMTASFNQLGKALSQTAEILNRHVMEESLCEWSLHQQPGVFISPEERSRQEHLLRCICRDFIIVPKQVSV